MTQTTEEKEAANEGSDEEQNKDEELDPLLKNNLLNALKTCLTLIPKE